MTESNNQLHPIAKRFMGRTLIATMLPVLVLGALHLVMQEMDLPLENDWLMNIFDMDHEANVPTWFASLLWLVTGIAATACYFAERKNSTQISSIIWVLIGVVFLGASCDEIASIHENVGTFLQAVPSQHASGLVRIGQQLQRAPNSPWIIYYLLFFLPLGLAGLVFLWTRLRTQKIFLVLVFLAIDAYAIAIGMDHLQGMSREAQLHLAQQIAMPPGLMLDLSVVVEESLEDMACIFLTLAFGGYALQTWLRAPGSDALT